MKKTSFIILFVLSFYNVFTQTHEIDSLRRLFNSTANDSIKIEISFQIGELYKKNNPNKALSYYRQGLHLSIKNDYRIFEAEALHNIARNHFLRRKYSIALTLFFKSLDIYENYNDTLNIAHLNMNIGAVYLRQHFMDSALIYSLNAMQYFKYINDTAGIRSIYLVLSAISIEEDNYTKAIEYLNDAYLYTNVEKEPSTVCVINNNYSLVYQHLEQYDKAYSKLQKSLKIAIDNGLVVYLPPIYINIGKTLFLEKRYNEAIIYYYKAKYACEEIDDVVALVTVYAGLSNAYLKKGFYKTALGFLLLAKGIIDSNKDNVMLISQIEVYGLLSEIYHYLDDDVIAFKYLNIKEKLHDSLVKIEKYRIATEIETEFQITEKNSEILDLQNENINTINELEKVDAVKKAQRRVLVTLIILFILILVFSIFILKNYYQNKKLNIELELKNKKIAEAGAKVEHIVNFLPEIFIETDNNGKITNTNNNFYTVTGYTSDDIKEGLSYYQLVSIEDRAKIRKIIINQIKKQEQINSSEIEFIKKDKTIFPAIISINIKNIGETYDFYGVIVDISEKKKTEQELLLLKTSVEQSDISVMITNNEGKIVYVNPVFEKNTGYSYNEAINSTPRILNSGKTSVKVYEHFWEHVLSGEVWRGTFQNKKKNGELFWERNIVSPLKDENGKVAYFVANKEDITAEVKQNEKINKLFTATENSPNSVIILDTERKITYVNNAFEKITGYEYDEVIGESLDFLNSDKHTTEFFEKIWNEISIEKSWQGTVINKRKNGELYWSSATIISLVNENNKSIGYVCNDVDITNEKKTQEKLKNTLEKLNEKNQEIYASLKYAQRIQNALIPQEKLIKNLFKNAFVLFLPKDIVSGDFYWTLENGNDKLIAVVDCTGHSVPGAFLSFIGFNFLEASVKENKMRKPSEILDFLGMSLRKLFSRTNNIHHKIQDDMEVGIISVNFEEKNIQFASSRNRLYLVREISNDNVYDDFFELVTVNSRKKLLKINGDRQYLAKKKESFNYSNYSFNYCRNDYLYMSTDGYYDQFGDKNRGKFKRVNFEKLLLNITESSMPEQKEILLYKLLKWKGETPQIDDITVVGIKLD